LPPISTATFSIAEASEVSSPANSADAPPTTASFSMLMISTAKVNFPAKLVMRGLRRSCAASALPSGIWNAASTASPCDSFFPFFTSSFSFAACAVLSTTTNLPPETSFVRR